MKGDERQRPARLLIETKGRTTQFIRDLITRFTTKVSAYRYPTSFASSCTIIACIDRSIKIVLHVMDALKTTTVLDILIVRIRGTDPAKLQFFPRLIRRIFS
jgi:hypothetical protein